MIIIKNNNLRLITKLTDRNYVYTHSMNGWSQVITGV